MCLLHGSLAYTVMNGYFKKLLDTVLQSKYSFEDIAPDFKKALNCDNRLVQNFSSCERERGDIWYSNVILWK